MSSTRMSWMQAHVHMTVPHYEASLHLLDAAAWALQEAGLHRDEGGGGGQ